MTVVLAYLHLRQSILNLISPRKGNHVKCIPQKLLKSSKTICSETPKKILNNCLIKAEFPNDLKLADFTPVLKKEDPSRAKNCRPVSVLLSVPKIFERILYRQVSSYADQFLSAIEKASTQQALLSLIERRRNTFNQMDLMVQYFWTFQRLLILLIMIF